MKALQPLSILESGVSSLSIDYTTDLPLSYGCNTILTYVECLKKKRIFIPYNIGDMIITEARIAQLLFTYFVRQFGIP